MKKKVLITSALPYANGPLHFGHIAGAYLPADCYARFQRLRGKDVLFICGSDEYGVAITLSAELAKRSPKEHVDHFHALNKAFFEKLHISFNHFSRTSWPGHNTTTQEFFHALEKKGVIEEKRVQQLYSEQEKRFLADRYVVGTCPKCGYEKARGDECPKCAASYEATDLKSPCSRLTGSPLSLKETDHFYLRFDKFKERLADWIQTKSWKENVLHFAKRYIEELRPRAITRDSEWGVPVPNRPGKVFYVWFDAPIGYISATQEWAEMIGQKEKWREYWLDPETTLVQFLGKDNIPFHAVFFPAMLMGQELAYKLPDALPANEFFLLEGRQFSKSEGWTIDLEKFFTKYSVDQARYMIAANAPETSDAEFSWKDFQMRCNAELLAKFGNFIHRTLTFAKNHLSAQVPQKGDLDETDRHFIQQIEQLMEKGRESFEGFHLRRATQTLMELSAAGNVYFDTKKPWLLAKEPEKREKLETTLALCLECIKNLALLASPIIAETSEKIWRLLGFSTELAKENWERIATTPLPLGQKLQESHPLFRRIEDAEIEEEIALLGRSKKASPLKRAIPFEQFEKLDLRVGKVVEAEKILKSKKLLKLRIDLGFEQRTIVSGIALSYQPEQLLGKKLVIVANLAPAKIMGIESEGMILAGVNDSLLELPQIQNLPPGSVIS